MPVWPPKGQWEQKKTFPRLFHKAAIMPRPLILASGSEIRLTLLRNAGLEVSAMRPRVDEEMIKVSLLAEGASPRDLADALAEMKARKVAEKNPEALVLGCDQVLAFEGEVWGKPESPEQALEQLTRLRGQKHKLLSAVVLYDKAEPVWRHVETATLMMRDFSPEWLAGYVTRNWEEIRHCAGGYQLESEGIRLFSAVEGDYFTILGLPLLPVLLYLGQRGFIET
jgi:septum formation protein